MHCLTYKSVNDAILVARFHLSEIKIPQFYKKTKNCLSDIGNYLRKIHLSGMDVSPPPPIGKTLTPGIKSESTNN